MSVWADTGVFLQGVGTVLGAIAVIVAGFLGASGVNKWRAQKITDRKIDQAERIVVAAYNVRRDLYSLRSALISVRELAEAEKQLIDGEGLTLESSERKKLVIQQVYYNRLNAAYEDRKQLYECQAMARALFGEELGNRKAWLPIWDCSILHRSPSRSFFCRRSEIPERSTSGHDERTLQGGK